MPTSPFGYKYYGFYRSRPSVELAPPLAVRYAPLRLKVIETIAAARRFRKNEHDTLALVPTMGALHEGHAALIRRARKLAGPGGSVAVSIFVNPTQFGPKEDLAMYPRPFASDAALCRRLGVDAIFHPKVSEIYPVDFSTSVDERAVSEALCGKSRPGHFSGVCTVVLKLFSILQPDVAVFGLKDYQQCRVIARMVRDLDLPVRLAFHPTVRERDGLAMSSRNIHLSPEEREQAPVLRRALLAARDAFRHGLTSAPRLRTIIKDAIRRAHLARVDYVEVVDGTSLAPVRIAKRGDTIAVAVFFGATRLIDNIQMP